MKKELLLASALTASLGLANVAEAASMSMAGSINIGVTGDDGDGTATATQSAVQDAHLSVSISETTDGGVQLSTGFTVVNEGSASANPSGLTLTFTDGSSLDLIEGGSAYAGAIASIPAASGQQGVSNTTANNAPTDLDWASTQDAVGFDWGSAADFGGVSGLTVGVSAGFGDGSNTAQTATVENTYSIGATYATDAGDTAITIGGGIISASSDNATANNNMADSMAVSIAATTGDLTIGAGYSNGSGLVASTEGAAANELDSVAYLEAGASYVSGDMTFTVSMVSSEGDDNALQGSTTTSDSLETVSASVDYTVASGVTATFGYTDQTTSDEDVNDPGASGSSWYIGAGISF